ncbi:Serine threonine- kinase chk1 [Lecanosticta acicola]|uniref:non-specific serine/threonine protein kinase n=1 Tax=Lecanosticta acicola TaxID=111012 RepID=A0AAI8Z022_9PEZI|nr:Serine threonine- kinase chk1 [Lecanosticta acicola]
MGGPPGSQVAPLPSNLPFRVVSKTIGSGAYASIRKAIPHNKPGPVIAVKFINKEHAFSAGRLRPKQLQIELGIHASVCPHDNIIKYLSHGEDASWVWMALELAEGGDLFDKIEADEGVGEDVAHFYFKQLVSAIDWCHGKGVAHRDIKPENMLLSGEGNLKLADFGLATQYVSPRTGEKKICGMVCGSPPYIAPEIIAVGHENQKRKKAGDDKVGYDPLIADVWSCAIVLFVLLVGNTPWDAPVIAESYEYHDYVTSKGRPSDELWTNIPSTALSLVRGMLNIDSAERMSLDSVRKHPWFTRQNRHINEKGRVKDPTALATQMLESLHIDFARASQSSQSQRQRKPASQPELMDIDSGKHKSSDEKTPSATQPQTPMGDVLFDWEAPPRLGAGNGIASSQPQTKNDIVNTSVSIHHSLSAAQIEKEARQIHGLFAEDPSMSQFSATPSVPLTLTQQARNFKDIVPSHSLARFISILPFSMLLPKLLGALHHLSIPVATPSTAAFEGKEQCVTIRIKAPDNRRQPMSGHIMVESVAVPGQHNLEVLEVRFMKAKGDPLSWRRFFKEIAAHCQEGMIKEG